MDKNTKIREGHNRGNPENIFMFSVYMHSHIPDQIIYNIYVYEDKSVPVAKAQHPSVILKKNHPNFDVITELLNSLSYSNYLIAKGIIENEKCK